MTTARIVIFSFLGLALLLPPSVAAAQESAPYSSGEEWLTKEQLRACLLLDFERVKYQPIVEDLRRKQQAASADYMAAYDAQSGEEEALARFQAADAAYGEARDAARRMLEDFSVNCADRPYSLLHFNQLSEELGFGWSSPR